MGCQLQNILSVVVLLLCLQGLQAVANCNQVTTPTTATASYDDASKACASGDGVCVRPQYNPATNEFAITTTDNEVKWDCGTSTSDTGCTGTAACVTCASDQCNTYDSLYECIKYTFSDNKWTKDSKKQKCDKLDTPVNGGSNCRVVTPDHASTLPGAPATETFCGNECTGSENTCAVCASVNCNDIDSKNYCKTGTAATKADYDKLKFNFCITTKPICIRPLIAGDVPVASDTNIFGCVTTGTCTDKSKCTECGIGGCNTWPEKPDFIKCHTWSWADNKWTKSTNPEACTDKSHMTCNLPKNRGTQSGYTAGGCGACLSSDATTCLETIPGKNAGNLPTFSVIAAFTALVFTLLI